MSRIAILAGAVLLAAAAGCFKATLPESIDVGTYNGSPAPPSYVAPADAGNSADVRRENAQLRQRVAYLEDQNHRLSKKSADLGREMDDIRADMGKIAVERDRYRQEAGR